MLLALAALPIVGTGMAYGDDDDPANAGDFKRYRIIKIVGGDPSDWYAPLGINCSNEVSGARNPDAGFEGAERAFAWLPVAHGSISAGLKSLPGISGINDGVGHDINDDGVIAGLVRTGSPPTAVDAAIWDLNEASIGVTLVWHQGGSGPYVAFGINDEPLPMVVGRYETDQYCGGTSGVYEVRAWRMRYDSSPSISTLSGNQSWARAVRNDSGTSSQDLAVGGRNIQCAPCDEPEFDPGACIDGSWWTSGQGTLPNLDGDDAWSEGYAVTDGNEVVGTAKAVNAGNYYFRPVWWASPTTAPVELPTTASGETHNLVATDIAANLNYPQGASGQDRLVVGSDVSVGIAHLWYRDNSGWHRRSLTNSPSSSNLYTAQFDSLESAEGVNDNGWIVGTGIDGSQRSGYVLIPRAYLGGGDVRGPSLIVPDGCVNFTDLLEVLSTWGATGPASDLPADCDGNGVVEFDDLLIVLGQWSASAPCADCESALSLEDELAGVGLTLQDMYDYIAILEAGTTEEKANWTCWWERYTSGCTRCPACPGNDPFDPTGSGS